MTTLLDRYLGRGEDWSGLSSRVSGLMPDDEGRAKAFWVLSEKKFLPNSPCLVNGGGGGGRNLMACTVAHVENSIDGIFYAARICALVFKSGGIGLEFSQLAPSGTPLSYAPGGVASGPVSFMELYQTTANVVMEGGLRRAAVMGCLNASHPDILDYISCKERDGHLRHFNISVTVDGGPDSVAPEVWDEIISRAHLNGEPGVVFLDNLNRFNPTLKEFGPIVGVNACSEVGLYNYGSCVLGSVVLPNVVSSAEDLEELEEVTRFAVRFLNRVIDVNHYPVREIAQSTRRTRDIGIGVMGWSTLLENLGIPFTSPDALELAKYIAGTIYDTASDESWVMAKEDGGYLPNRRRNRTLMAIAPTGHIARVAGAGGSPVSHSIYPDYAVGLDMTVEEHLDLLQTWQTYVDNGISYTVSFRGDKPKSLVDEVYRGAHERGLKSICVYRDGSREGQPCKAEGKCDIKPEVYNG